MVISSVVAVLLVFSASVLCKKDLEVVPENDDMPMPNEQVMPPLSRYPGEQQVVLTNVKEDTVLHVWMKGAREGHIAELYALKTMKEKPTAKTTVLKAMSIGKRIKGQSSNATAEENMASFKTKNGLTSKSKENKITSKSKNGLTLKSKEPTSLEDINIKAPEKINSQILEDLNKKKESGRKMVVATSEESFEYWYDFREVELLHTGEVRLFWYTSDTIISYIYAFEPETVQEQGIRVLYISPKATRMPADASYHLRAPLGWHNDPCGFSRTDDGLYHLFYQHFPHSQKWLGVHWGHVVSKDLVNWVHQPIFLRPKNIDHWSGGFFSGSAFPVNGGLRIYYTDHIDGRVPKEFQASVFTKDMYRPMGPPRTEIADLPEKYLEEFADDFRDPIVFNGPGNTILMTVGAKYKEDKNGVILLYKQNQAKTDAGTGGWEFQGIVWKDNRWKGQVLECSHLIALGDPNADDTLWVLMYALQNSIDAEGRQNLSPIFVGNFDGQKFTPLFEQMIDFATGSFAYTGFYDPISDETLVMGWLANWPDFNYKVWPDLVTDAEYPTAMTSMRLFKLSPSRDCLMIAPHPSLTKLRKREISTDVFATFNSAEMPISGAFELSFKIHYEKLRQGEKLQILFSQIGKGDNYSCTVIVSRNGLELIRGWRDPRKFRFRERTSLPITDLHFFVDVGSLEFFANGGRWTGCARIPDEGRVSHVQLVGSKDVLDASSVQIWSLKSTQPVWSSSSHSTMTNSSNHSNYQFEQKAQNSMVQAMAHSVLASKSIESQTKSIRKPLMPFARR